jgi:hypothetical protein
MTLACFASSMRPSWPESKAVTASGHGERFGRADAPLGRRHDRMFSPRAMVAKQTA